MSNAERQQRWRENNRDLALAQDRDRHRKLRAEGRAQPRRSMLRFIAFDGEGGGTDEMGRQNYQLLCACSNDGSFFRRLSLSSGEKQISDKARLVTADCLDFILAFPKDAILIGFFFGYDVTQILRDLPNDRMNDLFKPKKRGLDSEGNPCVIVGDPDDCEIRRNNYTFWGQYGIEYIPKQYFRVCRIDRNTCKIIKNSARTINEVGGFFQKSFVEALRDFNIGNSSTVDAIAAMKDRRQKFDIIGPRETAYCRDECILLAQLMDKFRQSCIEANIVPRYWRGAGHIAARLHETHKTPLRSKRKRSLILDRWAQEAYYGGRFEVTTIGRVNGAVWEYDINSAYPSAMLQLPCPVHGRWKRFGGSQIPVDAAFYISDISFRHSDRLFLCGFPIREKARLYFPAMGRGIYWSPEIEAARTAGAKIVLDGGFAYIRTCHCDPFGWVEALYEYRKSQGSQTVGYPIKLGINGLYGKFAQRIGSAPWRDYVMAGLITSITRAKLTYAYSQAPNDILYIATDAIYSRKRLDLDIGPRLGQWGETRRDGMFIVQPGIYWSGNAKPKTRGIPRSVVIEHRAQFEDAWDHWIGDGAQGEPPIVPVFVNQFIGLRAALARGKPELAGSWLADLREIQEPDIGIRDIDFDWINKRKPRGDYIRGDCMVTMPYPGRATLCSEPYNGEKLSDFQSQLIEREDDPDFIPWGNSGE